MIRFDREAPGQGVDACTIIENGKAQIQFTVYLTEDSIPDGNASGAVSGSCHVEITMYDPNGREAARMRLKVQWPLSEALVTRTLLIYPQLWQSVEAPHLYHVKALLVKEEEVTDLKEFGYPVCAMSCIPGKGFFLNDRLFSLHTVRYPVTDSWKVHLDTDLELLSELGANCICPDHFPTDSLFYEKCLQKGMILWKLAGQNDSIPILWGGKKPLVSQDRLRRYDRFYYYKACWSDSKVLHICTPNVTPQSETTTSVVVYSNQKKVALYVNGILHEFKQSPPEFIFEDIPLKGEHTVLSVQAGDLYTSLTRSIS